MPALIPWELGRDIQYLGTYGRFPHGYDSHHLYFIENIIKK
jgi:hypothetical protein